MKCVFNKETKKFTGTAVRWDTLDISSDEIIIVLSDIPDNTARLNDTEDDIRPATQAELDADADAELDKKADFANVDPFLKAFVLAVNDGSIVPGSNMTGAQLKAAVKAKL